MSRIVGIDLGTTNSLVAYVDDNDRPARVIPDRGRPARSCRRSCAFTRGGVLVGEAAQAAARPPADRSTVYSVKRLMGRGYGGRQGRAAATSRSGCCCRPTGS